jgi:hypothetical protein
VEQIISVGAEGTERELAHALRIQEEIGPGDLLATLVEQAVRGGAVRDGR